MDAFANEEPNARLCESQYSICPRLATLRLHEARCLVEERRLLAKADLQCTRTHAPLRVGMTPPHSRARAWRIDEHEIDVTGEILEHVLASARTPHLDVARARS